MELEEIRQISLVGFLENLGHMPVSRKGNDVWFRSPFRNERTASFKVDTQRNVWFDFGLGKGGDIFHLAGELTGSTGFMEQLEFLSGKSGILPLRPLQERKKIPRVSGFEDVKVTELSHEALKGYLKERGIDPAIAGRFCKEVAYGIRGKRYFAIGFMNRSGGYELRNPMFKGCISPKDISCVSLSGKKQDTCCVFEGFVDFLSALVLRIVKDEDCLVLNSVSNLERSYAVLEGYGKILCFLDRDRAGITALETLNIHFGNKVMDCSGLYDGLKDLNGKYSINSLVYWVTYVHNVVYSFYRSMIYCYINSTQRCAGSIVIDIIPTNGADKRKFFPFAPYFPVTNVIKRYFYPYFPAIIGIKGYSFPYFPYLSGIMKIKTALYSLFSRLDWHKTVVFPCLGEIYEGIRSLSWEIPVT